MVVLLLKLKTNKKITMLTLLILIFIYSLYSYIVLRIGFPHEEITFGEICSSLGAYSYGELSDAKSYLLWGAFIFLVFAYAFIIAAIIGLLYLIVTYLP
jgi:hypothetical protein